MYTIGQISRLKIFVCHIVMINIKDREAKVSEMSRDNGCGIVKKFLVSM
jgi:hypothetical protein